jgi:hypothetical protein
MDLEALSQNMSGGGLKIAPDSRAKILRKTHDER